MVNIMNKENVLFEPVIEYFKNNDYVKNCLNIKEKMKDNEEINELVKEIKQLQRKYVNTYFKDEAIKKQMDHLEEKLLKIPIYNEYDRNLTVINQQLDYFKESMNDYFDNIIGQNQPNDL